MSSDHICLASSCFPLIISILSPFLPCDKLCFIVHKPGAIIGDVDRNEVPFTIARSTPCEVRFGLFLAKIAPSLQNKKRALHANLRLDLDKLAGPQHFKMLVLLKHRRTKNDL